MMWHGSRHSAMPSLRSRPPCLRSGSGYPCLARAAINAIQDISAARVRRHGLDLSSPEPVVTPSAVRRQLRLRPSGGRRARASASPPCVSDRGTGRAVIERLSRRRKPASTWLACSELPKCVEQTTSASVHSDPAARRSVICAARRRRRAATATSLSETHRRECAVLSRREQRAALALAKPPNP